MSNENCLATWCADDDWCAITCTAEIISKKWHPVIIHRLLEDGPLRFNDLKNEIGGISNKVLSESLDDLEKKEMIDREIINDKPVRVKYSLTELGKSFDPVIQSMKEWGEENLNPDKTEKNSMV